MDTHVHNYKKLLQNVTKPSKTVNLKQAFDKVISHNF